MSAKRQPTHRVWAVQKNGRDDKGFWSPIAAGWEHDDGDGMTLKFSLWPVAGQDVVIREIRPRTDIATGEVLDDNIPY
jgi:hypothetical protein